MTKFLPIYKYAELKGFNIQTVYRWIREGKIKKEDIVIEEVVKKRIRINPNAEKLDSRYLRQIKG